MVVVEVRDEEGRKEGRKKARKEARKESGNYSNIKSNNPRLAGGEQSDIRPSRCVASMVAPNIL